MYNPDPNLFNINYRSEDNIAYLVTMLEHVWGVDRITTLMKAARVVLDQQEESNHA